MLTISLDRLVDLLDKAAEVDLPETAAAEELGEGAEDGAEGLDEMLAEDAAYEDLVQAVERLTPEELDEVLALALLARNAASVEQWQALVEEARAVPEEEAVDQVVRALLFTDEVEAALEQLGDLEAEDDIEELEEDAGDEVSDEDDRPEPDEEARH